ncbi:HAD-like domain-containing protein [Mycotypha africana]|uniref:HAD-like domain-containing protein n=1 Tax=Mycotypha africana TaxID=64632 RepID=UPI0023010A47|nr:HAD-like domain-containing protein [Mycotypha africana]KAI8987477.1 HAD-like domain-containing protein [Mycotypha africana]
MQFVQGFREIFEGVKYDTIACDIYGVLHDGLEAYPYSKDALTELKLRDEQVILLSNSTRLQDKLDAAMSVKFGITTQHYSELLSSGLLTKYFLKDLSEYLKTGKVEKAACHATVRFKGKEQRMDPEEFAATYLKQGKFFLAGDPDWQEPLYMPCAPTLERVHDWDQMEFVLLGSIRGLFPETKPVNPFSAEDVRADYKPLLDKCLEKNIPMICANPDVFAPNGVDENGNIRLLICPGFVGQMYEEMGGQVLYFGKPFRSIYEYLIEHKARKPLIEEAEKIGNGTFPKRIVCVGDNIATDVKGATELGLDVVLILGGVHWEELKGYKDEEDLKTRVKQLCKKHNSKEPTYLMPLLRY